MATLSPAKKAAATRARNAAKKAIAPLNSVQIAASINRAHASGKIVTVHGRRVEPKQAGTLPAFVWADGTLTVYLTDGAALNYSPAALSDLVVSVTAAK